MHVKLFTLVWLYKILKKRQLYWSIFFDCFKWHKTAGHLYFYLLLSNSCLHRYANCYLRMKFSCISQYFLHFGIKNIAWCNSPLLENIPRITIYFFVIRSTSRQDYVPVFCPGAWWADLSWISDIFDFVCKKSWVFGVHSVDTASTEQKTNTSSVAHIHDSGRFCKYISIF